MYKPRRTLVDVARLCDVSQSTVSRVLSNRKYGRFSVSPEVRERINRVARELEYRPSVAARNMSASKTHLVAVLGIRSIDPEQGGPIERAIAAVAQRLDKEGYEICMQMFSRRHNSFDLPQLRVDGVIAVNAPDVDDLKALDSSGIPYVSINGVVGSNGVLVAPDDRGGTFAALRHLISLGHRRIAYLDHPGGDARHPSVFERRRAFEEAQVEMGFSEPEITLPRLAADEPWDPYFAPFIRQSIIDGGATAILAYSHYAALSLLRPSHQLGLSVPDDFSLICFNDEPVIRLCVPALTAVKWPSVEVGRTAAELLLQRMAGKTVSSPPRASSEELVVGESTAPPPRSA
jgi:LacI family transcriptional regulator